MGGPLPGGGSTSMLNSLSSATSTRAALPICEESLSSSEACSASSSTSSRSAAESERSINRVNEKVEPTPYSDSTQICPPISSTSCLQIASPSPTPSGLRTRASLILVNMPKSFFCAFSSMPTPVSATETRKQKWERVSSFTSSERVTVPLMVNLTALYSRLSSTCRIRCESPRA